MTMNFGPIGGGGGGLPSGQAIVENGTSVTLNPAPGNVALLGPVNINVLGNMASFWLADNRTAITDGKTAPVQTSAGVKVGTGTIKVEGNIIWNIRLPPTVAGVSDGDIATATGGQTIDIGVAAGVPSFTVRSFPFWNPFTVTVGQNDEGSVRGFLAGDFGSITNQPVAGYTVTEASVAVGGAFSFKIRGARPLRDQLLGALIGINAVDFTISDYGSITVTKDGADYITSVALSGVTVWTTGQNIPIVIIPQA